MDAQTKALLSFALGQDILKNLDPHMYRSHAYRADLSEAMAEGMNQRLRIRGKAPLKVFRIRFQRDTRWDVYPQREPVQEGQITAASQMQAISEFANWRTFSINIVSVEELG